MGRRHTAPANDAVIAVPVFTTDPHGAALAAGVINGNRLSGGRVKIDARGSAWHGWTAQPQAFHGLASLGAGRPRVPEGSRLDQASPALASDPVQSIFEQRMAARRFS